MASSGTSAALSQSVIGMRNVLTCMDGHIADGRGDKAVEQMVVFDHNQVTVNELVMARLEQLQMLCDNMVGNVQGLRSSHKPLPECKSVMNLKVLGSNKSDFKSWNEKFINAITQGAGTPCSYIH